MCSKRFFCFLVGTTQNIIFGFYCVLWTSLSHCVRVGIVPIVFYPAIHVLNVVYSVIEINLFVG